MPEPYIYEEPLSELRSRLAKMPTTDLQKLRLTELRKYAKRLGVKGYSGLALGPLAEAVRQMAVAATASSGTFAAKPKPGDKRQREADRPVSAADEEESHRTAKRLSTDTTVTGETGRPDAAMPTTIVSSAASGQAAAEKRRSTHAGFSSYAASSSTSATVAKPEDKTAAEEDITNKVAAMDCIEANTEDIEVSQRGSKGSPHTCAGIPLHPFELTTHAMHTCMHAQACIQEPVRALLQRQVAEQRQQKLQIEPVSTGSATAKVPALVSLSARHML